MHVLLRRRHSTGWDRGAAQDSLRQQPGRGARGNKGALDVKEIVLQIALPVAQAYSRLHQAFEHANVIRGPDILFRPQEHGANDAVTLPQEFAIRRPLRFGRTKNLGSGALPGTKTGNLETEDFDDVHQQAAAIGHGLSRHIRPGNAAVLHGRGFDRVDGRLAGNQVLAFRRITSGVHVRDVRALLGINDNAAVDEDPCVFQPVEVGANAGCHNHEIGQEVLRPLEAQAFLRPRVLDSLQAGVGADRYTAVTQPLLNYLGPLRVDHTRQNLWGNLYHRELRTVGENGIKNRKRDKPCPHHDHRAALADLPHDPLRLFQGPETVDARAVSPRHRGAHGR